MVLGSVEVERTFSTINFGKSELCDCLTIHLNLVVKMYAQEFYKFETFSFYRIIWEWGKENYIMENSTWPLVRDMAILICMGIIGFLLAFPSIDVFFFFQFLEYLPRF